MVWKRIVEFGFHLLYNQLAWTYDIVSWSVSLGEWRKWQLASLQFLQGLAVLEIAHGPGHMLAEMHRQGWQVTALDLSPAMGRLAKARLKRLGLEDQIPLIRCRIPDIGLQSAAFDSILSQFPTSFIFEAKTLATLHRLLKANGVLVVLPEGHLTSRGPVSRFIHWLFYVTGQAVDAKVEDASPLAEDVFWNSLQQQFASAGFEARFEPVVFEKSVATVIVAKKVAGKL